jgi:hypothetical protein
LGFWFEIGPIWLIFITDYAAKFSERVTFYHRLCGEVQRAGHHPFDRLSMAGPGASQIRPNRSSGAVL